MAEWRQAENVGVKNGGLGNAEDYAWWVGQDGNVWANIKGVGVRNLGKGTQVGSSMMANAINMDNKALLDGSRRISDPALEEQASNGTGDYNASYASGSGSSYNAENEALKARMRGIYDRQISDINDNINSLDSQLKNTLAGVDNEYQTYKNEQQSSYNANKNDYDNSTLQNKQNLRQDRNDITSRASSGLRGLLRVLGAMGAGGGSEARYEVPEMVTRQANSEMDSAGRVYRQNQQNLDTDWGNYNEQFENDKKKLEDWYSGQVKAKKQENYEKGQSLLADLVTALGNRAQYGGDYGSSVDDAYNRIKSYRDQINDLGKFTPTQYTGLTSVYKAPDLASYDTGDTKLSTTITDSNTSASSPLLVALQGLNKRKSNNPYNTARA